MFGLVSVVFLVRMYAIPLVFFFLSDGTYYSTLCVPYMQLYKALQCVFMDVNIAF